MTVCRYFSQGHCRYGSRCRYQHVPTSASSSRQNQAPPAAVRFARHVTAFRPEDILIHDLTLGRPMWPFSSYGLNVSWESGANILHGDVSFEELRLDAYIHSFADFPAYLHKVSLKQRECAHAVEACLSNPTHAIRASLITRNHSQPTVAQASSLAHAPKADGANWESSINLNSDIQFTFGEIPELPPPS